MWKLKVLAQFFLALIPGGEQINYRLQLLNKRHTSQQTADSILSYARRIKLIDEWLPLDGSTVMEIGTGWNPISTLIFYCMGTKHVYTYDHLPHVRLNLAQQVVEQIERHIEQFEEATSLPRAVVVDRCVHPGRVVCARRDNLPGSGRCDENRSTGWERGPGL